MSEIVLPARQYAEFLESIKRTIQQARTRAYYSADKPKMRKPKSKRQ